MGVHRLIPRDWSFARASWDVLYSGMVHLLSLHLVPGILDPRPHESIWRSMVCVLARLPLVQDNAALFFNGRFFSMGGFTFVFPKFPEVWLAVRLPYIFRWIGYPVP